MRVKLGQKTTYFTTQESEAQSIIESIKEGTTGEIKKQEIKLKNHNDYGQYFEVTVEEQFTTSRSVLENGY
ncbi:hypothetical protein [Dolosigranulum savutiense]|uniref:Uncharacterized protein n=1 Tax=Dolosigranulum savutiense TaxID=3110288 RepID=A0AB74U6Z2_9LACT